MKNENSESLAVLKAIPHRPPFLFVDAISSLTEDFIVTRRTLRPEEFYFEGHYPRMPIMPGVLLCEAVFQTAGILLSEKYLNEASMPANKVPVLARIKEAKFKRMAFPGDKVEFEAKFLETLKGFYFFKGLARKEGNVPLMSVEFALGLVDEGLA